MIFKKGLGNHQQITQAYNHIKICTCTYTIQIIVQSCTIFVKTKLILALCFPENTILFFSYFKMAYLDHCVTRCFFLIVDEI